MQVDVLVGADVLERAAAEPGVGRRRIIDPDEAKRVALALDRGEGVGAGDERRPRGGVGRGREHRNPLVLEPEAVRARQGEDLPRIVDAPKAAAGVRGAGGIGEEQRRGIGARAVDRAVAGLRHRGIDGVAGGVGADLAASRVDRRRAGREREVERRRVGEHGIAVDRVDVAREEGAVGRDVDRVAEEQVVLELALAGVAFDEDARVGRLVDDVVHRHRVHVGLRVLPVVSRSDRVHRDGVVVEGVVEQHQLEGALAVGVVARLRVDVDAFGGVGDRVVVQVQRHGLPLRPTVGGTNREARALVGDQADQRLSVGRVGEDRGGGERVEVRVRDPHRHPGVELDQRIGDGRPNERAAVAGLGAEPVARQVGAFIDDAAPLDLDAGHVGDVGVVDDAPLAGVGQVVRRQRVAADVDVAAVAGLRRGQALSRVAGGERPDRVAVEDGVVLHPPSRGADGGVAERGDDDRHPLLPGRLVAGDAQNPELRVGAGVDGRAGGGVDGVVDAHNEAGAPLLRGPHARRAVGAEVARVVDGVLAEQLHDHRGARTGDDRAVGKQRPGQGRLNRQRVRRRRRRHVAVGVGNGRLSAARGAGEDDRAANDVGDVGEVPERGDGLVVTAEGRHVPFLGTDVGVACPAFNR